MITIADLRRISQLDGQADDGILAATLSPAILNAIDETDTYAGFFTFIAVDSGHVSLSVNSRSFLLGKGGMVALSPRQLVRIGLCSPDFHAVAVLADTLLMEPIMTHTAEVKALADWFISNRLPLVNGAEQHFGLALGLMSLMQKLAETDNVSIAGFMRLGLLKQLASVFSDSLITCEKSPAVSHQETIYRRFVALVARYYRQEHSTRFYASQLGVTPVYLARIVHRYSEKTVKKFIHGHLFHDACEQLRTTDSQIGDIARSLGFPDIETFSKFFKRIGGVAPSRMWRE